VKEWKRIEPTRVTKVGWRTVVSKTFELPDGQINTWDTLGGEDDVFAGVIGLTPNNRVILARQFRAGPEKIMDELPGGLVHKDEDPLDGAIREFTEETGYAAGQIELLGVSTRSALDNGKWYYYIATDCVSTGNGQALDSNEFVEIRLVSIQELLEIAKADKLSDPAAVLMAYDKLQELMNK
jgi:ADP-ribose pyrophosphatase